MLGSARMAWLPLLIALGCGVEAPAGTPLALYLDCATPCADADCRAACAVTALNLDTGAPPLRGACLAECAARDCSTLCEALPITLP